MTDIPNVLGVHALVWVGDTSAASIATAIDQTTKAGYGLLELSLHDVDNLDVAGTRALAEQHGIRLAASRGLAKDADVSSEDPAVVARGEQLVKESIDVVAGLGGKVLTGALYSAFGKAHQPLSAKGRANVVAVLTRMAAYAAQRDVTLGLEVCNRYETNVVNTARDALALADDIGSDNVMIHLDSYHMNIEEKDFATPVHELGERLGYVHIGENDRGYLGSGHLDFPRFFDALGQIGYTGPITFESFSSAVVSRTLSNDLAIWRNLWDDGFDLAVHARRYLTEQLTGAGAAARA